MNICKYTGPDGEHTVSVYGFGCVSCSCTGTTGCINPHTNLSTAEVVDAHLDETLRRFLADGRQ
jgi:hypothetical protein